VVVLDDGICVGLSKCGFQARVLWVSYFPYFECVSVLTKSGRIYSGRRLFLTFLFTTLCSRLLASSFMLHALLFPPLLLTYRFSFPLVFSSLPFFLFFLFLLSSSSDPSRFFICFFSAPRNSSNLVSSRLLSNPSISPRLLKREESGRDKRRRGKMKYDKKNRMGLRGRKIQENTRGKGGKVIYRKLPRGDD
jgi:hypothetical protein